MTYQTLRALLTRRFQIPKIHRAERAIRHFTLAEKALFYFFAALFIITGIILIWKVNNSFISRVPLQGGSITEGIIGNPRFINPVLALSEADRTLSSLVYSGLVRVASDGSLENDLAESISISDDSLTYTVKIKPDALFHDGKPVTSEDVAFTIGKIQDPGVKSPLFSEFAGIGLTINDERTLTFTLRRPYAPFIYNLTVGILPKHIWSSVGNDEFSFSQWNVLPIGSGPYEVDRVERDSGGIPDYYELMPFEDSVSGPPYVSRLVFKFYPTEADLLDAYDSGDIESLSGISPAQAKAMSEDGARVLSSPLPRVFGVFFNQNLNKALLQKEVRQALDMAAPKQEIIDEVLSGYGVVLKGPLPPGLFGISHDEGDGSLTAAQRLEEASALLAASGWTKNADGILEKKTKSDTLRLSLSLSTSDNPELKRVAEMLRIAWQELGAQVSVKVYEPGDLNQNVIRPRRYEALLFGEVVGRDADIYPFWHSSERNDPGLNIALYANSRADKLLSDTRTLSDQDKRLDAYEELSEEIENDVPAVFLYSPSFIYIMPKDVKGVELSQLGTPQDRFLGIREWYIDTNSVWNIFVKN
jgi:peptide/nickel transport system substrate-binding protein